VSLGVQAAEKVPVTFTLTVTNRGGFSGMSRADNAIYQLANGLVRLSRHTFPAQLNEITRIYFTRKAAAESTTVAAAMRTRQQRAGAERHRHGELPDAAGDDGG
jgi:hypothetical protein